MTPFEFATAAKIRFGQGTLREAGAIAKAFGRRALIVTGRHVDRAAPLRGLLEREGVGSTAFPVGGEPEIAMVEQGVAVARGEGCDVVISFGGGSAIDAGKAIAAMLVNPGELLDYLEVIGRGKALPLVPAPFIAIPTPAGTGSEVTRNAVLASPAHHVKVSLRSPLMLPRVAIVDPELTLDLPPEVTASTGMDALTQLIEPYVCAKPNPMIDALCVEGISRAARSLKTAFSAGHSLAAREDMSLASLFGGLALANAGLGAVHGFAGPIGGMFPAPHGAVCAALLPHVMRANIAALHAREPNHPTLTRYDHIARLLTGNPRAAGTEGAKWVSGLVAELKIPRLRAYGLEAGHIPDVVQKAAQASSMKANPIALTADELATVLADAI